MSPPSAPPSLTDVNSHFLWPYTSMGTHRNLALDNRFRLREYYTLSMTPAECQTEHTTSGPAHCMVYKGYYSRVGLNFFKDAMHVVTI